MVTCKYCNREFEEILWETYDVVWDPTKKEDAVSFWLCPHCHESYTGGTPNETT